MIDCEDGKGPCGVRRRKKRRKMSPRPQSVSSLFRWEDRVGAVVHCALGSSWPDFSG